MAASLEPVLEQPTAQPGSGARHSRASIRTQRSSMAAVCGYSSRSTAFFARDSFISAWAWGSIQLVAKVARFSRALPSSISSSCTSR